MSDYLTGSNEGYLQALMPGVLRDLSKQNMSRIYREDPVRWAEEYMGLKGQMWSKVREMMESVRDHYGTAVAAGHGVSKSWSAGLIACWWIDTHPLGETETFVATSAPSKAQVDAVWSYIRMFHARAKQRFNSRLVDHPLPGYITSGAEVRWKLPGGDTIAQGRKPPDNKSDIAFQGRHAVYLLVIGDEATGLGQDMLKAFDTIATGVHNRQLLLMNPTDPSCAAAAMWPREDAQVSREGRKRWNFITISMFDSPAVTNEEGIDLSLFEGISGPDTIERWREDYPEDDPQFVSRVLGLWPWGSADGILFTEEVLSRAMRCRVIPDPEADTIQFGVDVARMGKDYTVVYEAQVGDVWETDPETDRPVENTKRRGLHVRFVTKWKAEVTNNDPENPGTVQRLDSLIRARGATAVNIDAGAFGIAVIDGLRNDTDVPADVFEVYGQTKQNVDQRAYVNLRAEQYGELRRRMFHGEIDIDPDDEDLLNELRGIRYFEAANGAMQMESKEDMRRRNVKSPDHADAVWYAVLELDAARGPQAGDVVTASIDDYIPGNFWFSRDSGIGAYGW